MSSATPLQPFTNLFQRDSLVRFGQTLRTPAAIALFASIGIHGILWATLPLMGEEAEDERPERTVQMIELSPQERSQLPQLTMPSPLDLPATGEPLPTPSAPATESSPTRRRLGSTRVFGSNPYSYSSPYSLATPLFPQRRRETYTYTTPKQQPPKPSTANRAQPSPSKPETAAGPDSKDATTPETTTGPQTTPTEPPAPVLPDNIPEAAIARLRELQKQYREDQQGAVSEADATQQMQQWIARVAQSEKIDPVQLLTAMKGNKISDLPVPCTGAQCAALLAEGKAQPSFLIAVNPEGKVIEPIATIKTGNEELDAAASAALQDYLKELPATGNYEVHRVRVQFVDPRTAPKNVAQPKSE